MNPELIADYACVCGENPLWHPMEKRLYWTDIETGRLFWFDPASGHHEQCYEGRRVGGFTVQHDGSLLLFRDQGNVVVWRDGKEQRTIVEEIPDEAEANGRFNDVIADPEGRVFCGTLCGGGEPGRLYRLDTDGTLTMLLEGLGCSNGMGFTRDLKTMYFTDSGPRTIWQFDYQRGTGEINGQRPFVKVEGERDNEGVPDGMTVDEQDLVWSARWDGSCVVQYDAAGQELRRIGFPTLKCSSVTFGGEKLDEMYVTTAGGNDKAKNGDTAGALYRVDAGAKGRAEYLSRL